MKIIPFLAWLLIILLLGCKEKEKIKEEKIPLFNQAIKLYAKGSLKEAESKLKDYLKENPNDVIALELLENIRIQQSITLEEKPKKVIKKPTNLIKKEEKKEKIKEFQFIKEEKEVEISGLQKELLEEKEILPKKTKEELPKEAIEYKVAYKLYKLGEYTKALSELRSLINKYPNSKLKEWFLYLAGLIAYTQKSYDESIDYFKKVEELDGVFKFDSILGMSDAYTMNGNYEEALKNYLKLIELLETAHEKKEILFEIEPYPTKEEELKPKLRLQLARLYKAKKDFPKAIIEYETLLESFSHTKEAATSCFELADMYENIPEIRDFHKAYHYYLILQKEYPNSIFAEKARLQAEFIKNNFL
jgi:TolA-binding protein